MVGNAGWWNMGVPGNACAGWNTPRLALYMEPPLCDRLDIVLQN